MQRSVASPTKAQSRSGGGAGTTRPRLALAAHVLRDLLGRRVVVREPLAGAQVHVAHPLLDPLDLLGGPVPPRALSALAVQVLREHVGPLPGSDRGRPA